MLTILPKTTRRITALLICLVMMLSLLPAVRASSADNCTANIVPGDANGDGSVNTSDAVTMLRRLANWDVPINNYNADVEQDNKLDTKDPIKLLKFLAGWSGIDIDHRDEGGHLYTMTKSLVSCSTDSYTTYTCPCGYTFVENFVPRTYEHDFVKTRLETPLGGSYDATVCSLCGLEVVAYGNADSSWFVERDVKYYIAGCAASDAHNYELVIYGNGVMPDFNTNASEPITPPWNYGYQISTVTIAEGITTVGAYAFSSKWGLDISEVNMADSVEVIKIGSMTGVHADTLRLSNNLRKIEMNAFDYSSIGAMYWPKALRYIDTGFPSAITVYYEGSESEFMDINISAWNRYITLAEFQEGFESDIYTRVKYNAW